MAWTKMQTAIVSGIVLLLAAGTVATSSKWLLFSRGDIRFVAEGTVTYVITRPVASYTQTKHFIVTRDGNIWKIRTILEKEEYTGFPRGDSTNYDLYYEMGFDGTNLFTLEQQDKEKLMPTIPPKVLQAGNIIFAEGRVEKADSPPCLDGELLCPVWLAYCSAPYFANLKGNKAVSPLSATADLLSERIQHLQLPAKWKTNDRFFMNNISWFSDGTTEESGPDGKISIQKYRAPYDGPFLLGVFENNSWTNWNGISLPSNFKWVVYIPSYQDATNAKPTFVVGYTITGTLDTIRQTGKFSPVPELTMATHITDSRVRRGRLTPYLSTNRWDYSDAIR